MRYHVLGTISKPTGTTLTSAEGFEYPETEELEGYHVNVVDVGIEIVKDYIVVPSVPTRKFSGREDTILLRFTSEEGWLDLLEVIEKTPPVEAAKPCILKAISTMRVEVDGLGYDGDELSTTRMVKAIQSLVGTEQITWRLYNNDVAQITQTELGKVVRKAGILMSALWFCKTIAEVEAIVSEDTEWKVKYESKV